MNLHTRCLSFFLLSLMALGLWRATDAAAKQRVLQCKTDDGAQASRLVLDLNKRTMLWGTSTEYRITGITRQFVTAVEVRWMGAPRRVGNEVWVMDRKSGKYWRASVFETCAVPDCTRKNVEARTFKGVCR